MKRILLIAMLMAFAFMANATNPEDGRDVGTHWTYNPYTEYNMTLTGVVYLDGESMQNDSRSQYLEVGAFCGEECRGSFTPLLFSTPFTQGYFYFMQIYSDVETGETITFRIWDHEAGQELNVTCISDTTFVSDGGYGNLMNPYQLRFVTNTGSSHTQALSSGWNWWSTYIEMGGNNGLEQLENTLGDACIRIQSRNQYIDNYGSFWYGTLSEITNEQSYRIRTNAECNAVVVGGETTPESHPITIVNGWNWVGFPSSNSINVSTAMAGIDAEMDDQIKGRHNYASYLGYGLWYGTLNTLEPGQGYMYKSNGNETKTLVYQTGRGEEIKPNVTTENNIFTPYVENYADNMTLTAVIDMDGEELRSEGYELAVFVGNECRGSVKLMYVEPVDRYVAFLMAFGEGGEAMRLVLTDGNVAFESDDMVVFAADDIIGKLTEPEVIHFGTTLGLDNRQAQINIFPNPTKDFVNVEGNNMCKVEVVNVFGQVVFSNEVETDHLQFDLSEYPVGLYMMRVVTNKGIITNQIIKK